MSTKCKCLAFDGARHCSCYLLVLIYFNSFILAAELHSAHPYISAVFVELRQGRLGDSPNGSGGPHLPMASPLFLVLVSADNSLADDTSH